MTNQYVKNSNEVMLWIRPTVDGCWFLDENAPFLTKSPRGHLGIRSKLLPGHTDVSNSTSVYGLQNYSWVAFGNHELKRGQRFKTTCGNPKCMNPEHLIVDESSPIRGTSKRKEKQAVSQSTKADRVFKVIELTSRGMKRCSIAKELGVTPKTIQTIQERMLMSVFGHTDASIKDFVEAVQFAETFFNVRERREDPQGAIKRAMAEMRQDMEDYRALRSAEDPAYAAIVQSYKDLPDDLFDEDV